MGNHKRDGHFDKPRLGIYHPYEFFFCGYSNSGKTTLMARVVEKLSENYDVGCVKHCSHSFDFDHEGKDSWKLSQAGAQGVVLNAPGRWAGHFKVELDKFEKQQKLLNFDFVLAEGAKEESGDKILVLDEKLQALELLRNGEISDVKALVSDVEPADTCGLPWFQRDDIEAISALVLENLKSKTPPIKALLLTGGKSSRMGQDKAYLEYRGKAQINYMYDLLGEVADDVYVSCRNSEDYPGFAENVYLQDTFLKLGPLSGILSAMSKDAKCAWLVTAVDLPFVTPEVVQDLVKNRNPFKIATAYRSNFKDFPEPLFTIYEPQARHQLYKFLALGYSCPRKVLINSEVHLLDQGEKNWLDNANTPEEYEEICREIENEEN
ncbi:MAG: molybdopterin-guanine dinucleotide biosynthesis protein B [Lentisphaeraceae bacterium]|nr:molybdopterin-guanine dinucleotide biosynthesis protein B [Lentisphaeraceae bacterium]